MAGAVGMAGVGGWLGVGVGMAGVGRSGLVEVGPGLAGGVFFYY